MSSLVLEPSGGMLAKVMGSLCVVALLALSACAVGEIDDSGHDVDPIRIEPDTYIEHRDVWDSGFELDVTPDADDADDGGQQPDVCDGPGCNTECPPGSCAIGTSQCQDQNHVRACVSDATGCGIWTVPTACSGPELCVDGNCEGCIDNDGDGYGEGCALGPDCNDNDAAVNPGASERCDGRDTNCSGTIDEGFNVGDACAVGQGECRREGVLICSADGLSSVCNAVEGAPQAEVCDGRDNNCDGVIDSGGVCESCVPDDNFPNQSSITGTPLPAGQSLQGRHCPSDSADWFHLGVHNQGTSMSVSLTWSVAQGQLDMEMFVGGAWAAGSYGRTGSEQISLSTPRDGRVDVRVYYPGAFTPTPSGTAYTIQR